MTLEECYLQFGGDYQETLERLLREEIIVKYLKKFPELPDFEHLENALKQKDYKLAFRSAHNLKGVGLNLGLKRLHKACDVLCEDLRYEDPQNDVDEMLAEINAAYEEVCEAISELDE